MLTGSPSFKSLYVWSLDQSGNSFVRLTLLLISSCSTFNLQAISTDNCASSTLYFVAYVKWNKLFHLLFQVKTQSSFSLSLFYCSRQIVWMHEHFLFIQRRSRLNSEITCKMRTSEGNNEKNIIISFESFDTWTNYIVLSQRLYITYVLPFIINVSWEWNVFIRTVVMLIDPWNIQSNDFRLLTLRVEKIDTFLLFLSLSYFELIIRLIVFTLHSGNLKVFRNDDHVTWVTLAFEPKFIDPYHRWHGKLVSVMQISFNHLLQIDWDHFF